METDNREYDSTQEIRAMILVCLPYPPLPTLFSRVSGEGDPVLQTSHDLIARLLRDAAQRCTHEENKARQRKQQTVLTRFMKRLATQDSEAPVALYGLYCQYTRDHIATYLPEGAPPPDLRFLPLESTCKGDKVHKAMCDYVAGQSRILKLRDGDCADNWLRYEYTDMMLRARSHLLEEKIEDEEEEEEE